MIYNKNNDINKNTDIKKITDIVNNCEYKQKHKICETKFNMKIYNKIYTNNGIINMNNINIKYLYEILNYNTMNNNNKKYILYLPITKINSIKNELETTTYKRLFYYTSNNIIVCGIDIISELLPYFDNKYKNYNIKHVILYSSYKYVNVIDIKSDNFIWYLLSNNRNLNKIKSTLDKTIYDKIVYNHYININLDINFIPKFKFNIINNNYLYKQIKKIYTSEFNNFNTELLEKEFYKITNNYKPNIKQDILIFFINQFNDIKYPNYHIDIENFKNNYQCCILYDYPNKLSITKCCNNILDYESCINYFNQSNKCCICRKNFDSNKIDQHIYVHK
jgi:hypothetical protein